MTLLVALTLPFVLGMGAGRFLSDLALRAHCPTEYHLRQWALEPPPAPDPRISLTRDIWHSFPPDERPPGYVLTRYVQLNVTQALDIVLDALEGPTTSPVSEFEYTGPFIYGSLSDVPTVYTSAASLYQPTATARPLSRQPINRSRSNDDDFAQPAVFCQCREPSPLPTFSLAGMFGAALRVATVACAFSQDMWQALVQMDAFVLLLFVVLVVIISACAAHQETFGAGAGWFEAGAEVYETEMAGSLSWVLLTNGSAEAALDHTDDTLDHADAPLDHQSDLPATRPDDPPQHAYLSDASFEKAWKLAFGDNLPVTYDVQQTRADLATIEPLSINAAFDVAAEYDTEMDGFGAEHQGRHDAIEDIDQAHQLVAPSIEWRDLDDVLLAEHVTTQDLENYLRKFSEELFDNEEYVGDGYEEATGPKCPGPSVHEPTHLFQVDQAAENNDDVQGEAAERNDDGQGEAAGPQSPGPSVPESAQLFDAELFRFLAMGLLPEDNREGEGDADITDFQRAFAVLHGAHWNANVADEAHASTYDFPQAFEPQTTVVRSPCDVVSAQATPAAQRAPAPQYADDIVVRTQQRPTEPSIEHVATLADSMHAPRSTVNREEPIVARTRQQPPHQATEHVSTLEDSMHAPRSAVHRGEPLVARTRQRPAHQATEHVSTLADSMHAPRSAVHRDEPAVARTRQRPALQVIEHVSTLADSMHAPQFTVHRDEAIDPTISTERTVSHTLIFEDINNRIRQHGQEERFSAVGVDAPATSTPACGPCSGTVDEDGTDDEDNDEGEGEGDDDDEDDDENRFVAKGKVKPEFLSASRKAVKRRRARVRRAVRKAAQKLAVADGI